MLENYEHWPKASPAKEGKFSDERGCANDGEPNTAPIAQRKHIGSREYLTEAEVERLIDAARKRGRNGPRDAAAILLAYRHGLRAAELCQLRWAERL